MAYKCRPWDLDQRSFLHLVLRLKHLINRKKEGFGHTLPHVLSGEFC